MRGGRLPVRNALQHPVEEILMLCASRLQATADRTP
jgi:hypothetical protein